MSVIHLYPEMLANNTFPEVEISQIDYLGNGLIIMGDILWYGKDLDTPLIEGYGKLKFYDSSFPFSDTNDYIYHSHYQLPEEVEDSFESLIHADQVDGTRFKDCPSSRVYFCSYYYKNYWRNYFSGKPFLKFKNCPFFSTSMYNGERWISLPDDSFGYLDITDFHGLFIEYDSSGFRKKNINLLFKTNTGHYLNFSVNVGDLRIEFTPLKRPE